METAADHLDPRWPLPSVDMAYITETSYGAVPVWELRGWDGEVLKASNNRSIVFFYAAEIGLEIVRRH